MFNHSRSFLLELRVFICSVWIPHHWRYWVLKMTKLQEGRKSKDLVKNMCFTVQETRNLNSSKIAENIGIYHGNILETRFAWKFEDILYSFVFRYIGLWRASKVKLVIQILSIPIMIFMWCFFFLFSSYYLNVKTIEKITRNYETQINYV